MNPVELECKVRQVDNDVQSIYVMLAGIQGTQERHTNRLNELADRLDTVHAELGSRIDGVETRLGGVETRLDGVENRLGGVETRLDSVENRLGGVETRLGGVETRLDEVLDIVRSLRG